MIESRARCLSRGCPELTMQEKKSSRRCGFKRASATVRNLVALCFTACKQHLHVRVSNGASKRTDAQKCDRQLLYLG